MKITAQREGFSLIEVIVALMILTIGVLAMGAATGYIMNHIRSSELRNERMGAVREAAETLRTKPWGGLATYCDAGPHEFQGYSVDCEVTEISAMARVQLISEGPGYRGGRFERTVTDTFAISLAQP